MQFSELSNDVKALRKKFDTLNFLQQIDEVAQLANKAGEIAGTVSGIVFTIIIDMYIIIIYTIFL